LDPNVSASEIARVIKSSSSKWINQNNWYQGKFKWQNGFGVFSYSRSQIDLVVNYILNQHEHHRNKSFKVEYLEMLKKFEIKYDDEYLFDWIK
jgi:hypothetical protein